ncbi:MAG: tetratricopeptide repeat protein [Nitrospiraceae bacterium]|nr:MAG: tetratricopeptide repeat protein [Nitrospiraceae bacterium]
MKRHFTVLAFLIIVIILAYSNSIHGSWAMDDVIATNEPIQITHIQDLLGFRKVTNATFTLNQLIAPFSPPSFRLVNILIHVVNAFLIYILAYSSVLLWLKNQDFQSHTDSLKDKKLFDSPLLPFSVALLSSSIFALHPININAVAYIVQRMASLSTLFVLLSLLIYISARQSAGKYKPLLLYVLSVICIIIGIFSKENALMAVPLILLYDYVFLARFNTRELIKKFSIITGAGIVIFAFVSYFLNLHNVFLELVGFLLEPNEPLPWRGWMAADVSWTPLQHVLTEFRVLSRYLFLLILPFPQFLIFIWGGYPVSQGITEPVTTLLSMLLVVSLLFFSLLRLKRYPFLCFGILWYFIAISLESFFALGSDLYFEHRNYLPLSGFAVGLSGHVLLSFRRKVELKRVWTITIIICILLGALTFSRNAIWKDSVILWEDTLRKNPSDYRAHNNLGYAFQTQGLMNKALEHYRTAVKLKPRYPKAHNNLGIAYQARGFIDRAIEHYKIAVNLKPDYPNALYNLGNAYNLKGLYDMAIENYKAALELNPSNYRAQNNLGVAYKSQGHLSEAIEHYRAAIEIKPNYSEAYTNLGNAYRSQGLTDKAIKHYKASIRFNPNNPEAHINLAVSYRSQGLVDRADKHLSIARKLKPKFFSPGTKELP